MDESQVLPEVGDRAFGAEEWALRFFEQDAPVMEQHRLQRGHPLPEPVIGRILQACPPEIANSLQGLLLKHENLDAIQSDLTGKLYKPFDPHILREVFPTIHPSNTRMALFLSQQII